MGERRGNGSQPQAKYCSGASTGCFWTTGHSWEPAPHPGEAEGVSACSCQDGKSWTTLAVNFGCVNFLGVGVAKGLLRRQLGSSREHAA